MSSKVIIIDDEPLARSIVIEYIQHFPDLVVSQVCSNGFEGKKQFSNTSLTSSFLTFKCQRSMALKCWN